MITDADYMAMATTAAARARHRAPPNPWVGAVVVQVDGSVHVGATQTYGGPHAEIVALDRATDTAGSTVFSTLEPCSHTGQTGPCAEALIDAGVERVVVALEDPDPQVAGAGIERLRTAGIVVDVGIGEEEARRGLRPYLHHRRTGRPWVVLKLAATLDGRAAAPDGSSRWITGPEARADVHRLRAESDAVLVGAGTVAADDPSLTVRDWPVAGDGVDPAEVSDPRRVVLGKAPADARVHPCLEWPHDLETLLDQLGGDGVVQLMVEGGPTVAGSLHREGLVDQYVIYLAPAFFGGDDATPLFRGAGAPTVADVWRGSIDDVRRLGTDVRLDVVKSIGADN